MVLLSVFSSQVIAQGDAVRIASVHLRKKEYSSAERVLVEHLKASPKDQKAKVLLAVAVDQQGRSAEAESLLRGVLETNPKSVAALANLGVILIKTKRPDEAEAAFENVLKSNPGHQQALFNLASLYSSKKEYLKAIPLLERLVGYDARSKVPKIGDPQLLATLVTAYGAAGKVKNAEALSDYLVTNFPNDPRLGFTLGLILAEAGSYGKAEELFSRVNKLLPGRFEILFNLGIAQYNNRKLDAAQATFRLARRAKPDSAEVFYRLGLIAAAKGESENAVGLYLKAVELKPEYHEALFLLGEELSRNRLYTGAGDFYKRAAVLVPERRIYQIRLGVNHVRLREYVEARRVFESELKKYPNDANLVYLRGYLARSEGLYDEAIAAFEKARDLGMKNNADVVANLGFLAYQKGEDEKAEQLLREAIRLNPEHGAAHHDLGRLLLRGKKYGDSVKVLERGAELIKTDPGIHYQLFLAYSRLKQKEKANAALAEFKRLEALTKPTSGAATSRPPEQDVPITTTDND